MVSPAVAPVTESSSYGQSASAEQQAATTLTGYTDVPSPAKRPKLPSTEKPESRHADLVLANLVVPAVTGAQILDRVQESVGTENIIILTLSRPSERQSSIGDLPRPPRLVTTFEPHFRQAMIKKLQELTAQFRHSIGQPEAAALKAELRAVLTDTYEKSALNPETRNLGTAVSVLQDFLRPHWSRISPQKLKEIGEKLASLSSHTELTPRILEKFYDDLVSVVGRISVNLETDDEDADDASA